MIHPRRVCHLYSRICGGGRPHRMTRRTQNPASRSPHLEGRRAHLQVVPDVGPSWMDPQLLETGQHWAVDADHFVPSWHDDRADVRADDPYGAPAGDSEIFDDRPRPASGDVSKELTRPLGASWWDRPLWHPPRLWFVLGAAVLSVVVVPQTLGGSSDVATASEIGGRSAATADPSTGQTPDAANADLAPGAPGSQAVPGILRFGGNASASLWSDGPVIGEPANMAVMPSVPMCGIAPVGSDQPSGCGLQHGSQPLTFEHSGRQIAVLGGLDRQLHSFDVETGTDVLAPFAFGGTVSGSLAVDPEGFPLIYAGGDNGQLKVLATDRAGVMTDLWSFDLTAQSNGVWANTWTAAPLVIGDLLVAGANNGRLYIFQLHRTRKAEGLVSVSPELLVDEPMWDEQQLAVLGDRRVPIEYGPSLSGTTLWVGNGGGMVSAWDLSTVGSSRSINRVFRAQLGDRISSPVVLDGEGFAYVTTSNTRDRPATAGFGNLVKLDPRNEAQPVVWEYFDPIEQRDGIWTTPIITADSVIGSTLQGRLFAVDRETGAERWSKSLSGPIKATPIPAGPELIVATCGGSVMGLRISDTGPDVRWRASVGSCVEATPTVLHGRVYVGGGDGLLHVVGDRTARPADSDPASPDG